MKSTRGRLLLLCVGLCLLIYGTIQAGLIRVRPIAPSASPQVPEPSTLAELPLDFIENHGQWDTPAQFVARQGRMAASFEKEAIQLHLAENQPTVGLTFEDASPRATLVGEDKRSGYYNFFIGNDPARWQTHVAAYGSLLYRELYAGVDVRVREDGDQLRYDLLLAPGADVTQIVIRAKGIDRLAIADDGGLILHTANGLLRQSPPLTWEMLADGAKRPLESRFRIIDAQRYGFEVPGRDPSLALVIDPGLDWATFLGGNGDESVEGLAMTSDGSGDVVVAGQTHSPDFPHSGGNLVPTGWTPYVARLNATGTALAYATFFGGSSNHSVMGLGLDASGRPVVVGDTNSLDFPVTPGAYDTTPGNGNGDYDAYVIKFDATGGGPVFGTYLAGSPGAGSEQAWHAGHEPDGSVVVSGIAGSADFPLTPGAYPGQPGLFVSRLDPTGSQLTYSAFIGPASVFDMVVDLNGFVTLTGQTSSTTFPTTPDAFDITLGSTRDVIVARLKLDGNGAADLKYSTYLGGDQYIEAGNGIAVDPNNPERVTISGFTRSGDFPTTPGAAQRTHFAPVESSMAFVTRFHFPAGGPGSLVWSTLYGGPGNQSASDVVVDGTGAAIIVGGTAVNNPPTTERAYDRMPGDGYGLGDTADGYVARISADGSRVEYSTLLGGSSPDVALEVGYAGGNSVVVAGLTRSTNFPVTAGAFDTVYAADGKPSGNSSPGTLAEDVFVARLTLQPSPTTDVTPPPAPEPRSPPDGTTVEYPGRNMTLDWSDVTDESGVGAYHIQFSPNPEFRNDFAAELDGWFEAWLPTSVAVFTVGDPGTFSWRVQVLDGAGNLGPWSAVRTVVVESSTPAKVTLLGPPNNGKFAPGDVSFWWEKASGAKTYQIQIDTKSDFSSSERIMVSNITGTQYTRSLTAEKRYWWRVRGASDVTVGAWSDVWSFEIKKGASKAPSPPPSTTESGPATALAQLRLWPDWFIAPGGTAEGTVVLDGVAPAGGVVVPLASNYPDRLGVPASVTVPEGSSSATFTVTGLRGLVAAFVTGEYGGLTQGAPLAVTGEPVRELNGFSVSKNPLLGGESVEGTVALIYTFVAGPGGSIITLGSTNPALASVPVSVTIPAGTNTVTFTIATQPVTTVTRVTILASRSMTLKQTLELLPPGALDSLSLNPTTVTGGQSSQGTVTLSSPAPADGVVVALSSTNTGVAQVPASVTVLAGATRATFTVSTSPVSGSGTWSEIRASAGGLTRWAILNVNPGSTLPTATPTPVPPTPTPAPPTATPTATSAAASTPTATPAGPLPAPSLLSPANDARFSPGQTITFDWSDVTGAASYTIQIDDTETFGSSLIVNQTVTASVYTNSTLPTIRMWWRVRANDAAGNPGAWSTVRRFEVKN